MQPTAGYIRLGERLRRYTPALAALSRALSDARSPLRDLIDAAPGAPQLAARSVHMAQLTIGSTLGALRIHVDMDRHAALEAIVLEADSARRTALANLWLAEELDALAHHGIAQPAILGLDMAPTLDERLGVLHVRHQHGGASATATLVEASDTLAAALESRIASADGGPDTVPATLASVVLPTRVRLRSRRATPELLASLRPGDVLLGWPHAPGFSQHPSLEHVTVLWGAPGGRAACARARIDSSHLILESYPDTMSHDTDVSLDDSAPSVSEENADQTRPIDISSVELPVHIEVVTVNLPIAQIAALRPGYILTLPLTLADAEIRLVAHGQTLALGELVAVGDQLGLHIRHIANSDERHA